MRDEANARRSYVSSHNVRAFSRSSRSFRLFVIKFCVFRQENAAKKISNVKRLELAKVFPKEDGSPTPAYRTADLYFDDYAAASAGVATPEGQAYARDAPQLGTGGVKFLFSGIE